MPYSALQFIQLLVIHIQHVIIKNKRREKKTYYTNLKFNHDNVAHALHLTYGWFFYKNLLLKIHKTYILKVIENWNFLHSYQSYLQKINAHIFTVDSWQV